MPSSSTHSIPPEELKKDYPAHVFPPPDYRPPEYLVYLERAAAAVKTVRLIVYAGMAGFLLLAAYGFFLIYQLTIDTHRMVEQTMHMTEQMQSMARIMSNMHASIADMRVDIADMRGSFAQMNQTVGVVAGEMNRMSTDVNHMSADMNHMANTVSLIQHSARNLDASVGPAANMVNSFFPMWGGGNRYPGAPPYAPPAR